MFTGIIHKTSRIVGVASGPGFERLTVASDEPDIRDGDSIAINGVCLTVAEQQPGRVGFDVISETLSRTNLGLLTTGDEVHWERALKIGDRIDGHFVQGHVDGTGQLIKITSDDTEFRLALECSDALAQYIMPKGSVCLDGVSLTVANVDRNIFEVALIPTTLNLTLIGRRKVGWVFNLETDVLAKTIVTWLERQKK